LQRVRNVRHTRTLVDASWALSRLTDQRSYKGVIPDVAYSVCGVLDHTALNIEDLDPGLCSVMLHLRHAVAVDANRQTTSS
jgi:hypothetical protein